MQKCYKITAPRWSSEILRHNYRHSKMYYIYTLEVNCFATARGPKYRELLLSYICCSIRELHRCEQLAVSIIEHIVDTTKYIFGDNYAQLINVFVKYKILEHFHSPLQTLIPLRSRWTQTQ